MNPEELYLQYQSNGGNLSLEDFLNMQSYLEPNDFSALIQDTTSLKKKEDTNINLLSSQGLSTSNNDGNINPISGGQNIPQEILSVPIDSQLDLNQNQLDQQNGISNLENSNSESALTSGSNGTPFTTNLPVNTQNPLAYKGNMDNLILDENGNSKSKVGTISFPNDNPNNNTTTFNSGVTVPNIYLPDESKVDFSQLPKNYLSPRQYKPGELLDYSYQDFTGANIIDPESYAKDLESKGYIKPSYLKDGTRATLENGLPAFEITKNGAEYFSKESEKYVEGNNYEAAKQKLSPEKSELTDLEKYTNSLFDKYGYLVTEEDRLNYLQTPEGRKELQINLETQQELGSYPNATYQQVYDMVSRRYNKPDEYYLDKAQSVLVAMMDNQKQTAFDDFSNRLGSDNEIMPDDVAENNFYLEVEKNYDLKKLFGEFLDSEEGQLYTRTDQSIRNNTNGQRNRKNIWNAFSNWTNKKELLDIEAKQNNISNLKYNVQSAAESGDFNLVNQYVNQINSVQNSIQNNIKNVQQNDSITSDVNKIFTRVNKEDSEAQDFQARVLSGDGIARTQNILGQVVLGLGQSVMDASSGILRILTTPFSQNVKDSVDQLNEPLKLGNIEISPLRTNVTKYSDNSGRIYEERNGKLFQIENGVYRPVSNVSGLKETGKDSEYNPSGMAFLTGKMAGDILITNEVGGLINNTVTNNAISLASKTTQAFGAESEIAKQARNFARYVQSANSVENKSVSGWFVQMYNDSYKSAEDSGISSTAGKTVYATVNSFIQSLIQRINPDSKFLSGFNNEYKQLLSSLSTSNGERILANAKSLFTKIADNVVGETKEELIQQVVGDMTNYVTNVISGSDFKLTDGEGYKDVVVGTIVPSVIASLMGGSGSRNIKLGNNEINLSNYNRSQLLTELSRFNGADNMLNVMSNDSSFDSYSNTLDEVKNEVLTRKKYINKIPDSQNYSTESLDNAIKVLQQLENKRTDLNQADAAFKPRIESEISSLESQVEQILNENPNNESTTSPEQTPEGTQGKERENNTVNPEENNKTEVSESELEALWRKIYFQNRDGSILTLGYGMFPKTMKDILNSGLQNRFFAHGMGKSGLGGSLKELLNLFDKGIDKNRGNGYLYTAPLEGSGDASSGIGAGAAYSNGSFMLISTDPEIRDISQVEGILVNDGLVEEYPELINELKSRFPNLSIDKFSEGLKVANEIDGKNSQKNNSINETQSNQQNDIRQNLQQPEQQSSFNENTPVESTNSPTETIRQNENAQTSNVSEEVNFDDLLSRVNKIFNDQTRSSTNSNERVQSAPSINQEQQTSNSETVQANELPGSTNQVEVDINDRINSLEKHLVEPYRKTDKQKIIDWLKSDINIAKNVFEIFDFEQSIANDADKNEIIKNPFNLIFSIYASQGNSLNDYINNTVSSYEELIKANEIALSKSKNKDIIKSYNDEIESYKNKISVYRKGLKNNNINEYETNQNDLRSQETSVSNKLNPNQTRLSENVIATTKEIILPDGDNGYRVTITDNNGNLIEDRNGDSEFDFSDQSEVDKFINQKQRGFSLSKQSKIKTEVPVTESTPSTNYVGKRVSFNQFGDTRSGVVESENKGRLTIKGDDGKTYFTGSPLVQNLKDESDNPIQLQRSSENFIPISQEAFDSLIEKLKKPFAKAFKNLNITTDWNEFLNKSKSLGLNLNFDAKFSVNDNTRKEKQLELINKKNPAPNNYSTWIRTTNDILTADEAFKEAFQDGEMYPDFTVEDMEDVLNSGEVTVYSSYPIKEGVFVTPSRMNAESYSGDGKVYSKKVNASDLAWIDQGEGQYAPVKFMRNNNGTIYGAKLPDGTIYINPEYLNANTPIHEFSHLWEQLMPSRFKKGVELLKQTKTGKEIFNRLKSEGNYNNLSDNELWNEALNTHIGNYGEWQFQERQARGKMVEFVQWFKAFFNKIGDVLGIGNLNPNISLNNFTNKVLGDILGNKSVVPGSNSSSSTGTNFSIRTDNTNKLKIKDDVELSNFFGDNTTSIDELIAKGYNVSDDIANLARKFGTKIYVINENLFNKSENEINSYVDDLMKDYQILIDNGTYEESYLRQELLDGIMTQVFNDALGEAKGNSIYIKEGATDLNNFLKTKLVQHELAHVFTSYYLADNIDSSQLNEQELTFRNEARSAYEEALNNPNKTNAYGYSNTYEFIAEYIANDNFKSEVDNYLDSLNNPEPKSLLTRIVDYIKGLFGFKNNTELKQEFQLQKSIDEHINRLKNADGSINLQAYSGVRFMIKKLMPVSTIQEVLNETETKGIEAGLAKFKESAFYKSLSDKQKALIESKGITKLMQEQVILHREDQINKKKTAVEKAKEQTSKKEKEIAFNKIEKIHENYKNKIEELRKSNKSYREKVIARRHLLKDIILQLKSFLIKNGVNNKITPREINTLIIAANAISTKKNINKALEDFFIKYTLIQYRAEERSLKQKNITLSRSDYNQLKDFVIDFHEQGFGKEYIEKIVKETSFKFSKKGILSNTVKIAINNIIERSKTDNLTPEEARKKLDDSYKSSKEVLTKRFKDENGNVMSFNQKFRAWLKNKVERGIVSGVDRQFIPKRILENIGAKAVSNRMIAYAGSSTIAKEKFDKVQKNVYDGLNRSELELLDKIIAAKRFIAIDKNREEKGLPVVDHPGYQDASTAQKALDAYKSEIGEDAFTKLNKRANAYFDAFKNILSDMRESGLISNEVYEELKDVDYQPRKFIRYILDADGELMSSDRTMFRNENGNLSKEQIIGLSEGDASDMLMDSKWLIQSALASRYKAIGMNEINRTFFTKYYLDAKAKFESINPDNITEGDKKFYKYFKQLQSNIKENRIIGFTESGKPKYESTTPEGYKIAYYYENGVRHQVFMKEEFHKMWHDTMDKLVNSDLAQTISTWSGSRLVKAFATGNNPGFVFTNTPRDFVHALLFSPEYSSFMLRSGIQLTKDSIKAIGEIYNHSKKQETTLLTKYLEYGGGMEWLNQQGEIKDLTSLNKTIGNYFDNRIEPSTKKILNKMFNFVRLKWLSNYSETMFRVAVFDRSLQNQLKEYNKINNTSYKSVEELSKEDKNNMYYEAVASSRGLLDFNQGGTFTKSAESVIPYLNAATQGTRVMVEAIKRNPLDTSVRIIQAAGLPVLGMHLMISFIMGLIRPPEKEDEPVNKSYADFLDGISPSQKMNYWNIPVGWDKEEKQWKVLRIAKAQQLTPISILFEGAYEDHIRSSVGMTKRGSIKNTWKNFTKALGDNIDPTHLASALENPSKSQSYFDAAFKLIGSNPASKGLTQYYTGYDTFREQPLSFDIGKVSRKYEGADKANVEEFYKELGKALDDSPVRLKALVESIITSPQTNPFVGIMYGGADAIVTDVDAKKRAGVIYDSFIKRILSETSDFNRQLNKKALVQEQLDKNTDEYGETRNKAKQILNKYGSVNELLKNEKSLIADIEGYSKDPVIQKDLVNRIKSLVKKDGISSMVFDVKYGTNNNVKNKALLIYTYSEGMSSTEKRRFFEQLQSQKILSKAVISEYENVIKQNKK
ncbi:hypothetical protein CMU04_06165 [Elizabethkingia anophelis]|nr:hypothetical protein [Elizabethkingia anophelis]